MHERPRSFFVYLVCLARHTNGTSPRAPHSRDDPPKHPLFLEHLNGLIGVDAIPIHELLYLDSLLVIDAIIIHECLKLLFDLIKAIILLVIVVVHHIGHHISVYIKMIIDCRGVLAQYSIMVDIVAYHFLVLQ